MTEAKGERAVLIREKLTALYAKTEAAYQTAQEDLRRAIAALFLEEGELEVLEVQVDTCFTRILMREHQLQCIWFRRQLVSESLNDETANHVKARTERPNSVA